MDGLVFHGCAIPLPFPKHPGLKKQGPKPSQLFSLCNSSNLLRWMLRIGGAEAVADFCLERIDLAQSITEQRLMQRILGSAQRRMAIDVEDISNRLGELCFKPTRQVEKAKEDRQRAEHEAAWEAKKAAIIRADEQRRQQRVVHVPASRPRMTRQQVRAAAEKVIRELQLERRTLVEAA